MTTSQLSLDRCYDDGPLFIKSEICDQRRNKRYGRELTVTFRLQLTDYAYSSTMPFVHETELKKALLRASLLKDEDDAAADFKVGRVHMSSFSSSREAPTVGTSYNSVEFFFSAEKPSLTLSEEECLTRLCGGKTVIGVIQGCIDIENKRHTDAQHRERVAEHATWVAQTVAGVLHKEARKRCRYDARVAGLNAEYASHMDDLSKDELDGIWEGMDFELPGLEQDEVYAAAAAHLDKFLTKKVGRPGFRGRTHSVKISSADLDPARE